MKVHHHDTLMCRVFHSEPIDKKTTMRKISLCAIVSSVLLGACAGPQLPPDSPTSPASTQAPESSPEANSSLDDETTRAITTRLKETRTSQDKIDNHAGHTVEPSATPAQKSGEKAVVYTCPMHPEIQQDQPGDCPICGMTLIEK